MRNDPLIVAAFLKERARDQGEADGTNPLITISRQMGTEGDAIAMRASQILSAMHHGRHAWVVVDKNIAERVIEDHHLPARISEYLTKEETNTIQDYVEGLFGINVPHGTIVEKMTQTMVHLAKGGHVILVGRGAHVVTAGFPRAVHVRIIGSPERRVARIMATSGCLQDEAMAEMRLVDQKRHKFVQTHFHTDIDDLTRYDIVLNTDRISVEESAQLLAQLVSSPDFRKREAGHLVALRQAVLH